MFLHLSLHSLFFNDYVFTAAFLSFVFERPLRPFILGCLRLYWTRGPQFDPSPDLPRILLGVIEMACNSLPGEPAGSSLADVLDTMNAAMMHQRTLAIHMIPLLSAIFRAMLRLDSSASSQTLINSGLQFLALISNEHLLTATDRNAIEHAVRRVYDDNPPHRTFERMVQLLSTDYLTSLTPSFPVRQPKVFRTLLVVFERSERLSLVLTFIQDLCRFLPRNRVMAHQGGVDLWLIDFFQAAATNNSPDSVIKAAMSLLIEIAVTWSSSAVVDQFVGLLSPISAGVLSNHPAFFLETLNNILKSAKCEPNVMLPTHRQRDPRRIPRAEFPNARLKRARNRLGRLSSIRRPHHQGLGIRRDLFNEAGCRHAGAQLVRLHGQRRLRAAKSDAGRNDRVDDLEFGDRIRLPDLGGRPRKVVLLRGVLSRHNGTQRIQVVRKDRIHQIQPTGVRSRNGVR
jgi:hypothetical protein